MHATRIPVPFLLPLALAYAIAALSVPPAEADARIEQVTTVDMPGAMGSMLKALSRRGGEEGLTDIVLVSGQRKLERRGDRGTLIDLDKKKIYEIDYRRQRYSVRSFDELRREMEQAFQEGEDGGPGEPAPETEDEISEYDVTFDVSRTEETRTIAGHECRKTLLTITARPREGSESEGGELKITAALWIGPKLAPIEEITAFERRYAEAIGFEDFTGERGSLASLQMAYPALVEGMKTLREHERDFEGSVLLTEVSVAAREGAPAASGDGADDDDGPPKVGRMLRKLGGVFGRKRRQREQAEGDAGAQGAPRRILTMTTEVRGVGSQVDPAELAIPEGFRLR